jgi:hypothetical protein
MAKGEGTQATTLPVPVSEVVVEVCGAARAVTGCETEEQGPGNSRETVDLDACLRCCGDAGMVQGFMDVERVRKLLVSYLSRCLSSGAWLKRQRIGKTNVAPRGAVDVAAPRARWSQE